METVIPILIMGLCLMASTIFFTAPSVSLEGNTLWIIKSLPVSSKDVLRAKLNLQRNITVPAMLFVSIVSSVILSPSIVLILALFIIPVLYVHLTANIGLICNLKHPNLKWINETQVVKQSLSVLLSMFINSAIVIIPAALFFLLKLDSLLFISIYAILIAIGWILSDRWIMSKGAEIFDRLD